jgi:hypothetical protein
MKEKINKRDFIKLKSVCSVKDSLKRLRQARLGKKIAKDKSDKGLLSKICKELKFQGKKTNNLI